jgi:hypothetical protein
MPGSNPIGGILCELAFVLTLGSLLGAVFLRGGCALYNWSSKRLRSMSRVPEPSFDKAMGITFVTSVVGIILWLPLAGLLTGPDDTFAGASGRDAVVRAYLISFPVSFLVTTGMNSALLPTTLPKGFLVTLCSVVVALFVVAALVALFGGIALGYYLLR